MDEYEEGLMHRPEKEIQETQVEETNPYVPEPIQKAQVQRKQTSDEIWKDAFKGPRDKVEEKPESEGNSQTEINNSVTNSQRMVHAIESLDSKVESFETLERLGEGNVSVVDLVRQDDGSQFAYKHIDELNLAKAKIKNPEARSNLISLLREEIKLINKMGQIDPEHFPRFAIDFTSISDKPGFLTEYFPEDSLEKRVGTFELDEALNYIHHAIIGVNNLHKENPDLICLGDIKPSNLMTHKGVTKIIDLNLRYSSQEISEHSLMHSLNASIIGDGSKLKGTPRYLAPEQWDQLEGKEVTIDQRVDVFQLAALGYELITGVNPKGNFEPIENYNKDAEKLEQVIRKAMAQNPKNRHETVEEFLLDFREATKIKEYNPQSELEQKTKELDSVQTYTSSLEKQVDKLKNQQKDNKTLEVKVASKEVASRTLGTLGKIAYYSGTVLTAPLNFPTIFRKGADFVDEVEAGVFVLFANLLGSGIIGSGMESIGYLPEYLTTLAATNVASVIYEIARHHKNKLREEKLERIKSGELPEEIKLAPGTKFEDYDYDSKTNLLLSNMKYEIQQKFPEKDIRTRKSFDNSRASLRYIGNGSTLSKKRLLTDTYILHDNNARVTLYNPDEEKELMDCVQNTEKRLGITIDVKKYYSK